MWSLRGSVFVLKQSRLFILAGYPAEQYSGSDESQMSFLPDSFLHAFTHTTSRPFSFFPLPSPPLPHLSALAGQSLPVSIQDILSASSTVCCVVFNDISFSGLPQYSTVLQEKQCINNNSNLNLSNGK